MIRHYPAKKGPYTRPTQTAARQVMQITRRVRIHELAISRVLIRSHSSHAHLQNRMTMKEMSAQMQNDAAT